MPHDAQRCTSLGFYVVLPVSSWQSRLHQVVSIYSLGQPGIQNILLQHPEYLGLPGMGYSSWLQAQAIESAHLWMVTSVSLLCMIFHTAKKNPKQWWQHILLHLTGLCMYTYPNLTNFFIFINFLSLFLCVRWGCTCRHLAAVTVQWMLIIVMVSLMSSMMLLGLASIFKILTQQSIFCVLSLLSTISIQGVNKIELTFVKFLY